jgi:hypothetical protein
LRSALKGIGEPAKLPLAIRSSFGRRTPHSLRMAMAGMSDPLIGSWFEVGEALSIENTDDSDEGEGIASDGKHWFTVSNKTKRVVVYSDDAQLIDTFVPSATVLSAIAAAKPPEAKPPDDPHYSALCFFQGTLFVPIQRPYGVWRIDLATRQQKWTQATDLPEGNLFVWCCVHPVTGVLYTSIPDFPTTLRAYDRNTLARRPADDIVLRPAPLPLLSVQGATFTDHARVLIVCGSNESPPNTLSCYSSLNGHCFGAILLGNFGSMLSEVQAVTVRSWQIGGAPTPVHVLELDNDVTNPDDLYLHSYNIPDPGRL